MLLRALLGSWQIRIRGRHLANHFRNPFSTSSSGTTVLIFAKHSALSGRYDDMSKLLGHWSTGVHFRCAPGSTVFIKCNTPCLYLYSNTRCLAKVDCESRYMANSAVWCRMSDVCRLISTYNNWKRFTVFGPDLLSLPVISVYRFHFLFVNFVIFFVMWFLPYFLACVNEGI